jgi:hypothetical protein
MAVRGDGNCLFNAIFLVLFGHENTSSEIRLKTFFELFDNASFYVGCLTYIKNKFPLNDAIIKHAVLIDPLNRKTVSQQSLLELISALPEQIIQLESREALCAEFCEYQSMESTVMRLVTVSTYFGHQCKSLRTQLLKI